MNVEARERELLAVVEAYRVEECARLVRAAREEATRLVRQAHREARRRVQRVVSEDRARIRDEVRAAESELATLRRMREQRAALALLEAAWKGLRPALQARWTDPPARAAWVRAVVAQARAHLPAGAWTVSYPPGLAATERETLRKLLVEASGQEPALASVPTLRAGLLLRSGHAMLDGSIDGLLANREWVESRLLGLLERRASA
jgi:vacuolar-type H+-ATPase subunit H